MSAPASHPILSCPAAAAFEAQLFQGDEGAEWAAMSQAGVAVATAILRDFEEIGGFAPAGRVLVLAGKGHNGGDALIAAREILARFPAATATVVFVFGARPLRPLAQRAWRDLAEFGRARVSTRECGGAAAPCELLLDGVFGLQFRAPLAPPAADALRWANAIPARLRAAVDLPSGLGESDAFRADFTYATGIVKAPVLACNNAGRLRYLDLGFFAKKPPSSPDRILGPEVLAPLTALRAAATDKRTYGHLLILGGSRSYPGAVLMTVLAALRSGVGLITAFVPESLLPAFAARAPEAMWVGWPETPEGNLALEGESLLAARWKRGTALEIGPGLGREPETLALVANLVKLSPLPVLLDADALQPDIVKGAKAPLLLTPHAGEFSRIAGPLSLRAFAAQSGAAVVKKGPVTEVAMASQTDAPTAEIPVYHSFFGGPVLARGGSGDVLAGLTAGLLAQTPEDRLLAACRGLVWHGRAADLLARAKGQVSVTTTELIEYLSPALRDIV